MVFRRFVWNLVGFLFVSTGIFAQSPAVDAVNEFLLNTGWASIWDEVNVKPAVANLQSYVVLYSDRTVENQKGFVDKRGRYVTVGGELITDPKEIAFIKKTFTLLAPQYSEYNLNTYAGKFKPSSLSQIVFVDRNNRYALKNATVLDTNTQLNVTFNAADANIYEDWAQFLFNQKKKIYSFPQGRKNAPRELLVLGDPNCPFCHWLYAMFLPFTQSGELVIHWSLYAREQEDSRGKVLAIYDADLPPNTQFPSTPSGAFDYNSQGFIELPSPGAGYLGYALGGAISPTLHASSKAIRRANQAQAFSCKYDIGGYDSAFLGIPIVYYRTMDGSFKYAYSDGLPFIDDLTTQEFVDSLYVKKSH